ncbi:MAG TPA: ABC transporter permease [candidate division Zixibacteria bacterium]|nr:ABC transporter permease [candidate division Zixibacteria bacterium]
MKAIMSLAAKDMRLLFRDRFAMFWVIVFPLLMATFFGSLYSTGGGSARAIKLIVVDEDQSDFSKAMVAQLNKSEAVQILECPLDSAVTIVRRGKAVAYLHLLPGLGKWESLFESDSARIRAGIDPARKAEAAYLRGVLMQSWFTAMQSSFFNPEAAVEKLPVYLESMRRDTSLSGEQKAVLGDFYNSLYKLMAETDTGVFASGSVSDTVPGDTTVQNATGDAYEDPMFKGPKVEIVAVTTEREGPRSSWEITFPQSLIWALIGVVASFAVTIVTERTRGTMIRLQLAPITRAHVLAGKGMACLLFCLGASVLLLGLGRLVFGIRTPDPLMLFAAILAGSLCFVGIMMLISVLGKTEQAVSGAGWAILLIMSMIGGGMVPIMFMPGWLVPISNFSPIKWSIYALEGAIWRGFSWGEMMMPIGILLGIGALTFVAGVLRFRKVQL